MKILKPLALLFCLSIIVVSCDQKGISNQKEKEITATNMESISLHVSGMTCEIGCAKTIQSKLSKKEGVAKATVTFTDSIATVDFDANKISKEEIMNFIDGIAGGDLYSAKEISDQP